MPPEKAHLEPGYEFTDAGPRPRTDLPAHGLELEAPAEWVIAKLETHGKVLVTLAEGERAWNPASTKRLIYGPCEVEYTGGRASGGITATVRDHG